MKLANKSVSSSRPPLIIAEMSGNHNQSLKSAIKIVEEAARVGVDAVKIQTYTPETMTINSNLTDFLINENNSLWRGQTLYKLYKKAYTPWEWHKPIFDRCKELGIIGFSTPFDETAVDFLETLNVPLYKIASFENNHLPLIKKIAETGKPIIISTGMASISELVDAVNTARKYGCKDIILLKCTSSYPASPERSNLRTIPHLKQLFNCEVGLSDHTLGIGVAIASVAFGASVIEKHLTLKRSDGGVDAAFSLEPDEMKNLVLEAKTAWQALGKIHYGLLAEEKTSMKFRRSIYVVKDMKKGDIFSSANIKIIRPGFGLPPKYYVMIVGKKITKNAKKGTRLNWEMLIT